MLSRVVCYVSLILKVPLQEAEWIRKCMTRSDGAVDESAISNWLVVNQWNFMLIGSAGAGMYFHNDHLAAASWQASVVGRKRWILCR